MFRYLLLLFLLITLNRFAIADSGSVTVTGNLLSSGCSVSGAANLTYNLKKGVAGDLPDENSTYGRQHQAISLSCDEGTIVHITIEGNHLANNNSILSNTGTGKGVNIQLLNVNNTPIRMGEVWTPIIDANSRETIVIGAQYIRTGNIVAGTVSASATYTLKYE
ncbi:fimbrial protein [Pseudescherichia sp.]|uniref:fimbrial protein n=1 Tax=Pseudescherichia sp. TaxID=2055881 RepID=UPI00289834D6|nr:fimbrial protein [Pseudescherichia sp.]